MFNINMNIVRSPLLVNCIVILMFNINTSTCMNKVGSPLIVNCIVILRINVLY